LCGGDIHGAGKDGFAGAQTLGLASEHGPVERLGGAFFSGNGAKRARHEDTVTQATNKHERSFTMICSSP
jgi:hypothetical protein